MNLISYSKGENKETKSFDQRGGVGKQFSYNVLGNFLNLGFA